MRFVSPRTSKIVLIAIRNAVLPEWGVPHLSRKVNNFIDNTHHNLARSAMRCGRRQMPLGRRARRLFCRPTALISQGGEIIADTPRHVPLCRCIYFCTRKTCGSPRLFTLIPHCSNLMCPWGNVSSHLGGAVCPWDNVISRSGEAMCLWDNVISHLGEAIYLYGVINSY